jgi:hypothetical protein
LSNALFGKHALKTQKAFFFLINFLLAKHALILEMGLSQPHGFCFLALDPSLEKKRSK